MIKNFLIGSDPEFGVVNQAGTPSSVIGILPGNKKKPFDIGEGCGVQVDNVMAELTIPPANTKQEFVNSIMYGKQKINELLAPYGLMVRSISSARYSEEALDNDIARTFGCDPSYCIYTKKVSPRPTPEEVGNLRSCGTHIHIGADRLLSIPEIERLIFCMDMFLGVPSILIDEDSDRRRLYGNAGDFRFTNTDTYTRVEYRTLGGIFTESPQLMEYVYDQTIKAIDFFNNNPELEINKNVEDIINNADIETASEFTKKHKIHVYSRVWNLATRTI